MSLWAGVYLEVYESLWRYKEHKPEKQRKVFFRQRQALSGNERVTRSDDMTNITIGGLLKKIQAEITCR